MIAVLVALYRFQYFSDIVTRNNLIVIMIVVAALILVAKVVRRSCNSSISIVFHSNHVFIPHYAYTLQIDN